MQSNITKIIKFGQVKLIMAVVSIQNMTKSCPSFKLYDVRFSLTVL